jgi:hypothetical protein
MLASAIFLVVGSLAILLFLAWSQSWRTPLAFVQSLPSWAKDFLLDPHSRSGPWQRMSLFNPLLWLAAPMIALMEAANDAELQWDAAFRHSVWMAL